MRRNLGFTLIEVMIVVAIIAILAAIAIPSYTDYVRRGRITDAVSKLSALQVKMEQYFQDHRTYDNPLQPPCQPGPASSIAPRPTSPHFTFNDCSPRTTSTYRAMATGQGSMLGFTYTINEAGVRATAAVPAGWANTGCGWVLKKDGTC
jgi:type IV pilus assembly protein PilE